jgi:Cu2+-exporting ATPase
MSTTDRPDLEPAEEPIVETIMIEIDGMHSPECARAIEQALRQTDGVERAEVHAESRILTVTFDTRKTHAPALHDVILKTGYRPSPYAE